MHSFIRVDHCKGNTISKPGIETTVFSYNLVGDILGTVLVMIGKFAITGTFTITYNYTAELFPTVVRTSAVGVGSMGARITGALTPLIMLLVATLVFCL